MIKWLEQQRIIYTLNHHPIPHECWQAVTHHHAIFNGLSAVERAHLKELATLFLQRKTISGAQGLIITSEIAVTVAAQACLLILKLGLEYYEGWLEVILYPSAFQVSRENKDDVGLTFVETNNLSGEAWQHGPVILAWDDIKQSRAEKHTGHNLVIHEFAHKLDMLNGRANGMPPLHKHLHQSDWTSIFSKAFDHLQTLDDNHAANINPYAAISPAEFFAVVSEYFFTAPKILNEQYPELYHQLSLFYQQDPLSRLSTTR